MEDFYKTLGFSSLEVDRLLGRPYSKKGRRLDHRPSPESIWMLLERLATVTSADWVSPEARNILADLFEKVLKDPATGGIERDTIIRIVRQKFTAHRFIIFRLKRLGEIVSKAVEGIRPLVYSDSILREVVQLALRGRPEAVVGFLKFHASGEGTDDPLAQAALSARQLLQCL